MSGTISVCFFGLILPAEVSARVCVFKRYIKVWYLFTGMVYIGNHVQYRSLPYVLLEMVLVGEVHVILKL